MPPSRALDKAFDPELPAVRKAIDALEVAMGGRQSLIDTLSTADDPDVEYLLGLIADPRSDDKSLGHLCDQGNITPGQLLKLYRTARIARAQVLALDKVAERTPAVAADVMRRAENHYRICESCAGNKQVWVILRGPKGEALDTVQQDCRTCEATGQVLVDASLDHQRMALELVGLLTKGGGTSVAVGVNVQGASAAASASGPLPFAALQLAVQKVLNPQPQPAPEPVLDAVAEVAPE